MKTSNGQLNSSTQLRCNWFDFWSDGIIIFNIGFGQDNHFNPFLPILWQPYEITRNGTQEIVNICEELSHAADCNFYTKSYIEKCLCSKGGYTKQLISNKRSKGGNIPKTKNGFYLQKHGKLQIIGPKGACFRVVRFRSVKNVPVNLAKSIKVVHAQYRDIGSINIYPWKEHIIMIVKEKQMNWASHPDGLPLSALLTVPLFLCCNARGEWTREWKIDTQGILLKASISCLYYMKNTMNLPDRGKVTNQVQQ